MITTVLIDVDNTLLDFNECAKATIKTAFKNRKLNYNENVFSVFKEVNDILWCKIETGEIDKQTLYQLRWKTVLKGWVYQRTVLNLSSISECFF